LVERFGPDVGDSGYLPGMANRVFGHISDNPVGTTYVNREAAADAGVHRPLSRARGDEDAYRDYRDRYRDMATSLGFEGHMEWAGAMP
jgi:hypothetical protein